MRSIKSAQTALFVLAMAIAGSGSQFSALAVEELANPTYTAQQAAAGKTLYTEACASCHGENLDDGQAPPLFGSPFQTKWGGKSVYALYTVTKTTMPVTAPGSLSEEQYTNLLAYIFQKNILIAGAKPLVVDRKLMEAMIMPAPSTMHGQLEPGIIMPPAPNAGLNPLDRLTAVTDAVLRNPPEQDWLTWRRTTTAQGYSPLKEIAKGNVGQLKTAWSWALPHGANEGTPLVHDGVMFVYGFGDVIQALNAATGDLLWEYARQLPKGVSSNFKKAIALYGENVFFATSDGHMVALKAKTGDVVWDAVVGPEGSRMTGGPLVAKGKVIVGTGRRQGGTYAGAYIVALNAATGKEAWRFKTIPGPNEPGGDTWNDLAEGERSGASVWTPGSYDPDLNLVFFGPSQTYDTGPLRDRKKGSESTNDALYTDTTVALNPDTGKLMWHYQHLPNDQWDLDWAFERQIVMLPVNGDMKKVVVTAGKDAIHDIVEAKTGKYLFSMDLGLQNFVTAIDPKTGAKSIDPTKIPGDGMTKFVCPHVEGAKNWIPSAFNPESKTLYVSLIESCMYMTPVGEGERGLLTTGVRISLAPRENSDGLYGRIQAINLETRKTVWTDRQRAPRSTGMLATGGGVVFGGSLDRVFAAYDDTTGKKLWSSRLSDVPHGSPITYSVNGKQYVAVIAGLGGNHSKLFMPFVPEIKVPVNRSPVIWVFELPEKM